MQAACKQEEASLTDVGCCAPMYLPDTLWGIKARSLSV